MSSLAMKRVVATALAGAAMASAIGATPASARPMKGSAWGVAADAGGSPAVPPPSSSIAASAGAAYEELRAPDRPAAPPPPPPIAAPAGQAYEELRAPDEPAAQPTAEPQPVADEPSGFDLPSAAIGAVTGAGLVIALLAAGGLVRRRPLTRRHGTARA